MNGSFTGDAEIVQTHAMKIRIDVTVSDPPLERILNILKWFAQIFFNLARSRSDMVSH
jgi:hypothetical protein